MSQATQLFSGYQVPHLRITGGPGWIRWVTLIALFVVWQALSVYNQAHRMFNPVFLPSPTMVLQAAGDLARTGELQRHIVASGPGRGLAPAHWARVFRLGDGLPHRHRGRRSPRRARHSLEGLREHTRADPE